MASKTDMKKILKLEDQFIIKFLKYLKKEDYIGFPDNITTGKSPDYYLPELKYLVEVKRVFDRLDLERWTKWAKITNNFNKALEAIINDVQINGTYLINTPEDISMPTEKNFYEESVKKIIEAVNKEDKSIEINGYQFEINKVNQKGSSIAFGSIGKGHFINVAKIIFDNIQKQLKSANSQLGFKFSSPASKKVVLLVNQYRILSWDWDLFEGISFAYKELFEYQNIDEIWIQSEENHTLLFDRNFFVEFEKSEFSQPTKLQFELFAKWFSPLEKLGNEKKEKLLKALKVFLTENKPHSIFPEVYTRIEIVRFGRWLAENDKLDDASWLIKQFLDDIDPLDPPTEGEDDGNELHRSIKNATKADIHAIHTVKGHLAWTVQLLALKKDYIKEAYYYTQKELRSTKHLYLILQWIFPLIEISNRRFWLKEVDEKSYKDFKQLCFELIDSYSKYPDIAKALTHVFSYFKELNTREVKIVLDSLEKADDYAELLLYFALYRINHFKDAKYSTDIREYDPTYAKDKLEQIISSDEPKLLNLRSGLAWNIWKILSEEENQFDTLSPLIDKFLSTPYENHLYHNFERIVEDHFDKHSEKTTAWFIKIIKASDEYIKSKPDNGRNVWLGTAMGRILNKIAKTQPEELPVLIEMLYEMWMKGAFIGTISEVFNSYKAIENPDLRVKIKEKYKSFYLKMKEVNEKLEPVDWNE